MADARAAAARAFAFASSFSRRALSGSERGRRRTDPALCIEVIQPTGTTRSGRRTSAR